MKATPPVSVAFVGVFFCNNGFTQEGSHYV